MKTPENSICPLCGEGSIASIKRDFVADVGEGRELRIPNVEMEVCDKCGEEILSLDTAREIDVAVANHRKRISPERAAANCNAAKESGAGDGTASMPLK